MRLPEDQRKALREQAFERRLEIAIRAATDTSLPMWAASRPTIDGWYAIRNRIGHGESTSGVANIATVLGVADAVAQTLKDCLAALADP